MNTKGPPLCTAGLSISEMGTRISAGAHFAGDRRKEDRNYTGTMVQVLVMVMMPMIRALMIPAM